VVGLLRVAEALRPTAILDVCLALVLLPVLMPAGTVLLVDALEVNGVAGAGGDGAAGGGGEAVGGGSGAPRPGAAGGRRVKQVAKRVTTPAAPSGRQSIPTDRYRPPSPSASTRVVVAKKRKSVEVTAGPVEPVVVQAHAVPISAESGRAIIGQHEISRKFNKNHVSIKPVKTPPLPDMTLSSFWHAVSQRNNELIITYYYCVIIRNNELIITCYYNVIIRNNTSNNAFLLSSGFHLHEWVTHLRRVHASNPPVPINGKAVKGSDPLAAKGEGLYYIHGKTAYYNDFFFDYWNACFSQTFRLVCPFYEFTSVKDLENLLAAKVQRYTMLISSITNLLL
jgi:hypothetical protein